MIKKRWGESILLFFVANLILHNLYAILKKNRYRKDEEQ